MSQLSALPTFPQVVCALDLETAGPNALKPDRADLAVVGLKVYTWDMQGKDYLPGSYEYYAPTDFPSLQQRLDELPGPIVGHNLFNFDYLVLRHHLNLDHVVEKSADTFHLLYEMGGSGEEGSLYGLDRLAKENFGEGKTAKGSTVPQLLKDGKLAEVLVYNERDCDLTFRLWWKMVSERHVSTGEILYDDDDDFPPEEVIYNLKEEQVSMLTCATPRFTYATWSEQLERDGWIVMPPPERRRREKERERQRKETQEAAKKRNGVMQEFITRHLRDDIPHKYVPEFDWQDWEVPLDFEATRIFLERTELPKSVWIEEMICRLLRGETIRPAKLELVGCPDDPESRAELVMSILIAFIADGYIPHYTADGEANDDDIFLANPPRRPRTFAEQYVDRMHERDVEHEAMYGPADIGFEIPRLASNVHFAFTAAMKSLRGDEHLVFEDMSYVLDTDEISLFELQPKMLTREEITDFEAYIQAHPADFTISQ